MKFRFRTFALLSLIASVLLAMLLRDPLMRAYRVSQLGALGEYHDIRYQYEGSSLVGVMFHGMEIDDRDLAQLATIPTLKSLEVSSTNMTNEGVKHILTMQNLEVLNVSENQISEESFLALTNLPRLRILGATDSGISPAVIEQARRENPGLRILAEP